MASILTTLGYNTDSETLCDTPKRWAEMMVTELSVGEVFTFTKFANENPRVDQMVVVANIPFYSLCAHHVIPFFGIAHVAYLPTRWLAGLSKLARTVDYYARTLSSQEVITQRVLERVVAELEPMGAGVVLVARHLCMEMRGVEKPGAVTTTSALAGVFLASESARAEFFRHTENRV
jgi:GTP cyclohydrolase I